MRRCCQWIAFSCFAVGSVYSQTTDTANLPETTFKTKTHVVVEDVVVMDHNGEPILGLHKEDFQILEEGNPQTIASFEEHKGVSDQGMPPLPPNVYTNYPTAKPADSVNVVLLDTLNTPLADQMKVHLEMISFLKSIPAGSHIAFFTLSSGLHMVQGFTSDASTLLAALNKKSESRPSQSPLLSEPAVNNLDTEINTQVSVSGAGMPAGGVASAEMLQQFQNQMQNSQDRLRMTLTMKGLQALSNYLTGVPGRKNVIWFSESFPLSIIPGRGVQNYEFNLSEQQELRKTVNMLAAAQVAIYPISPEGLEQKFDSSQSRVKSVSSSTWRTVQGREIADVTSPNWDTDQVLLDQQSQDHARKNAHETTMDRLAEDTGGEAFFNTNGLQGALARVISEGAHYYTISYSSTDKRADGKYRTINVKLLKGDYHLAYRHGYFAEEADAATKNVTQSTRDPLRPLMIDGIPDATQIVYKIRLLPLPPRQAKSKGDTGKMQQKKSLTRYGIDFAVLLPDLTFKVTTEGQREAKIEIALVAYDKDGIPINSEVKSIDISLNPQLYTAFANTGVPLHEEIDVSNRGVYLRTGICDLATGAAGTLEVPLNEVTSSAVFTK